MNFLMFVAYAAAVHALWVPASAWVAADREKWVWVILLAIPGINVLVLVAHVVGVLPLLLPQHTVSSNHPMRRGGPGGHATRTSHTALG
jgi:hypothetical protein